ncbi:Methyltransferase domain protein [Rubripirellula amarantea]|uniref:Methyltransferase domain protein n=1 Tax=Rubripirellula amarantea TaxID=2527999 RepID=A0A5C5WT53_9BACT|nr:methyltransferase domain-containing protein [Rubripirellula amarantea]TWT53827.1 Methyltransferase domain protein [Rubripirellula amarantea]
MTTHAARFRRRSYWNRAAAVLQEWLREPTQVASLVPSTTSLTRRIAERECIRNASAILDLGPGTGGTTEALLEVAQPNCRVLAIEKTDGFIESLHEIDDPRLIVEHGDVMGLGRILLSHQIESLDVIVSGIPFSTLSETDAVNLCKSIDQALPDGGTFIAYQLRSDVARYADPHFGRASTEMVWINVPPLRVFTWTKHAHV